MANLLPNVPYREPIADPSGLVTPAWSSFFQFAFLRMGKSSALSNTELAAIHADSNAALQKQVTDLTATVATLQTQVTSGFDDLGQGPVL